MVRAFDGLFELARGIDVEKRRPELRKIRRLNGRNIQPTFHGTTALCVECDEFISTFPVDEKAQVLALIVGKRYRDTLSFGIETQLCHQFACEEWNIAWTR